MSETWTIGELAERAALALRRGADGAAPVNGRVRDVPGERLIRWYTTIGLVDPPLTRRGRIAQYGRRHLLQLVAVKRLQASGHSIADIQVMLAGATDRMLETAAGLPPATGARGGPGTGARGTPDTGARGGPGTGMRDGPGPDPSPALRPGVPAGPRRPAVPSASHPDPPHHGAPPPGPPAIGAGTADGVGHGAGTTGGSGHGAGTTAGSGHGAGTTGGAGPTDISRHGPARQGAVSADISRDGAGTADIPGHGAGSDSDADVRGQVRERFWAERPAAGAHETSGHAADREARVAGRRVTAARVGERPDAAHGEAARQVEAGTVTGVRLAGGVRLVLDARRAPSEEDVQAVLAAAAPLLAVLEERELT
ncbi:helix-turn-helix domain-containing protein [Nonomuraea phyllanthi]|uniref:helix-turn-helix domain-containing protein n=1 Tax=Nonomuraea phyllanthi TaxID=2219224 RepID=UPI001D0033F5|nr:helix-turn-helix domain-containing protein [Nonomuraea phyllanthi]